MTVKVVCAACREHYADIEGTFDEMLVLSDALAVYHLAHCQASSDEKEAAWQMMEAASTVENST